MRLAFRFETAAFHPREGRETREEKKKKKKEKGKRVYRENASSRGKKRDDERFIRSLNVSTVQRARTFHRVPGFSFRLPSSPSSFSLGLQESRQFLVIGIVLEEILIKRG